MRISHYDMRVIVDNYVEMGDFFGFVFLNENCYQ